MKQKLFVLSMDAMVHEDVAYMMTKPNFVRLMEHRSEVEKVCTIYPSITYPAHVSISTGCRPGKHGVVVNTELNMVDDGADYWFLEHSKLKVEDLFTAAKRAGLTTAAVFWPVAGNHPDIDWLINEYFFPDPEEDVCDGFAKFGANEETLAVVRENWDRLPTERFAEPYKMGIQLHYDHFINGCACSLIRHYQPDLLMIHNCYLDSIRHAFGVFHANRKEVLDQFDEWLGELMQAMQDAGVYERTNFVILSDHGQMDYSRNVAINAILRREGFIQTTEDGREITEWKAISQSNGKSATIFLRDPDDHQLYAAVQACLEWMKGNGYVKSVLTADEVRTMYGTYGDFSFMVEADDFSRYSDSWNEKIVSNKHGATHGYFPEKGPQPVFMGRGPSFRLGVRIPEAPIINDAPTLARIIGAKLPEAEGVCMNELLRI